MSDADALPDPVRTFLSNRIERYEDLQLLLFLRARHGEWWSSGAIAERLLESREDISDSLDRLRQSGLVQAESSAADPLYQYVGRDEETSALVDELAHACSEQPLAVVKLMTANALERLRASSVLTFSQAFSTRDRLLR
jgi:hypothetical protein